MKIGDEGWIIVRPDGLNVSVRRCDTREEAVSWFETYRKKSMAELEAEGYRAAHIRIVEVKHEPA